MADRPENEPNPDVATTARGWVARHVCGEMSGAEQASLRRWLDEAPAHRQAFDRELAFWHELEPLRDAFAAQNDNRPAGLSGRFRAVLPVLAAVIVLALVALPVLTMRPKADYRTGEGEQLLVTLPDGSTAFLNTKSAMELRYSENERRLVLLSGEAYFDVEKDKTRPFRVVSRKGMTEAVGTEFIVQRNVRDVSVAVTEGTVRVTSPPGLQPVSVPVGMRSRYAAGGAPHAPEPFDMADAAAWRDGRIVIRELPLRDAVRELDRYFPGRVLMLGSGHAADKVSGVFRTTSAGEGIEALAAMQGLKVHRITDRLIILN